VGHVTARAAAPLRADRLEACASFNLRKTARAVSRAYDAALAPSGIDAAMLALLAHLAGVDKIGVRELSEGLVMDPATASRHLRPAIRRGFVRMTVGTDRRRRFVNLTAKGRDTLRRAVPLWRKIQGSLTQRFGERRLLAAFGDLSEMRDIAKSSLEEAASRSRPAARRPIRAPSR
jgi:DNA-binding MarR family transcriptional regulator